MKTDGISVII